MDAASASDNWGNNPITKLPPTNNKIDKILVREDSRKRVNGNLFPSL
jgi:hypothetical protein